MKESQTTKYAHLVRPVSSPSRTPTVIVSTRGDILLPFHSFSGFRNTISEPENERIHTFWLRVHQHLYYCVMSGRYSCFRFLSVFAINAMYELETGRPQNMSLTLRTYKAPGSRILFYFSFSFKRI